MKTWFGPLLFTSCLFGAVIGAAEAKSTYNDNTAKELVITNVDAITTAPLHVRSGPGKHYKSYDILPADFPLVVGSCTQEWCQVFYNNARTGWATLPYLAFKQGGRHYEDPNLGPFGGEMVVMRGPRRFAGHRHRMHFPRDHRRMVYSGNSAPVAYNGGNGSVRTGWWTNYQRPTYQRAWQKPRWWQKH